MSASVKFGKGIKSRRRNLGRKMYSSLENATQKWEVLSISGKKKLVRSKLGHPQSYCSQQTLAPTANYDGLGLSAEDCKTRDC